MGAIYFAHLFEQHANALGIFGVFLVLLAYMLLQLGRMSSSSVLYSLLNTVGSGLILISLYYYWNLASGVIEIAWLIISLYGLIKSMYRHFRKGHFA